MDWINRDNKSWLVHNGAPVALMAQRSERVWHVYDITQDQGSGDLWQPLFVGRYELRTEAQEAAEKRFV